eukprot:COSAG05_NODE_467_length_9529_cov_27.560976_11_plen_132_part_00
MQGQSGVKCLCRPEDEKEEDSACQVYNEEDPTLYEEHCLAAFMLWACPFIGSGISIVFGVICALLARTVDDTTHSDSTSISPGTKIFIYIMVFGCKLIRKRLCSRAGLTCLWCRVLQYLGCTPQLRSRAHR